MANRNPKPGPGRPKGSGNKTPILMQEIEQIVYELPKAERLKRLREYRDFSQMQNPHRNFVSLHLAAAKRQEESGQEDLFNHAEEQAMIERGERMAGNVHAPETMQ